MTEFTQSPAYSIAPLTHELAEEHATDLSLLANQIPQVEYTAADILADRRGERSLLNKWQHSLIAIENTKPIAFIMGYERLAEGNAQYPDNTLYISELAVAKTHQSQGIGRLLLKQFFELNNAAGFQSLLGELNYSTQTNLADWNSRVISLYESFGFLPRATKEYLNRTDIVLGAGVSGLQL